MSGTRVRSGRHPCSSDKSGRQFLPVAQNIIWLAKKQTSCTYGFNRPRSKKKPTRSALLAPKSHSLVTQFWRDYIEQYEWHEYVCNQIVLWVFWFCFVCFWGSHPWHMEVSRLGTELELQLPARPQQHGIWATCVTYITAHGNTGSPTQWVRPGIKPASSWILVRFISAVPSHNRNFL